MSRESNQGTNDPYRPPKEQAPAQVRLPPRSFVGVLWPAWLFQLVVAAGVLLADLTRFEQDPLFITAICLGVVPQHFCIARRRRQTDGLLWRHVRAGLVAAGDAAVICIWCVASIACARRGVSVFVGPDSWSNLSVSMKGAVWGLLYSLGLAFFHSVIVRRKGPFVLYHLFFSILFCVCFRANLESIRVATQPYARTFIYIFAVSQSFFACAAWWMSGLKNELRSDVTAEGFHAVGQ